MKITAVTVSYSRTQSLENYSNVRPGLTLTAELAADDDPDVVKAQLYREARAFVEEACDQALEADDRPAKFSAEPRFTVWSVSARYGLRTERLIPPEPLILVTSDTVPLAPHEAGRNWASGLRYGLRLSHARAIAKAEAHKRLVRLIDCADGDLSRIPVWVFAPSETEAKPDPEAAAPLPFEPEGDEGESDTPF